MSIFKIIFWLSTSILAFVYLGYYLLCRYVVNSKKLKVKNTPNYRPKVSIVIPTWNEESTIKRKLENTFSLHYPSNKVEVIVIDSGSTDKTRKVVKKFKKVRLITERERSGKAKALNNVFKHCKGDIIVISDADCILDRNILLKSMPYFSDSTIGGLTGRQILLNPEETIATKTEKRYRDFYFMIRQAESIMDSNFIFHGEFTAFRKELLDSIFNDSVADDSELALRIRKKNYRTLMVWDAVYREYAPPNLSDRTKQKFRRAQGLVQIMSRFFSTFFFNPKYGLFGLLIFPVEFFMHAISPFLVVLTIVSFLLLPLSVMISIFVGSIIIALIPRFRYLVITFLHSQYACLKGILNYAIKGPSHSWKKIEGTRRYWKWK